MSITEFISSQPVNRQELLAQIHAIIVKKDKTITATVAPMMGKEMPLKVVKDLITDCSKIDLRAMKQAYIKSKTKKT